MRKAVIAILLAFAVTLAVVVGNRMSAEAMAVVVGVVCGVAAAIPMSLLILLVSRRRDREVEAFGPYGQRSARSGAYPPVVVIQGGTPTPNPLQPPFYGNSVEAAPRQFHIVGEQE
jgi:hypothetical protein